MTSAFLRAFRFHIHQARNARAAQFYRLSAQVRCQIGPDLYVSHIVGPGYEYAAVWTTTPNQGYVRMISKWWDFSAAVASAQRLARRRMRVEGART